MYPEPPFTRREGDALVRKLEWIDERGTRGLEPLAEQTRQNTAAIGQLQAAMERQFARHTKQHERELRIFQRKRRHRYATVLATVVCACTVLGLLLSIVVQLSKIHTP